MNAMPTFGLFTKPFTDNPGNDTVCVTPGSASAISLHAADHALGAIERGRFGQLRERDEVLLVLLRDEAVRHGREAEPGEPHEARVDRDGDCRRGATRRP